jgi:hypothetical protein
MSRQHLTDKVAPLPLVRVSSGVVTRGWGPAGGDAGESINRCHIGQSALAMKRMRVGGKGARPQAGRATPWKRMRMSLRRVEVGEAHGPLESLP